MLMNAIATRYEISNIKQYIYAFKQFRINLDNYKIE